MSDPLQVAIECDIERVTLAEIKLEVLCCMLFPRNGHGCVLGVSRRWSKSKGNLLVPRPNDKGRTAWWLE
jgi:hypothetical protein